MILYQKLHGFVRNLFSYESAHVIPDHEVLFNAFPFDDTLFETHSKQDYVLSDETFFKDESCEENSLDLHGIAPHIPLSDDYSEESEIEDLGDDVASCDFILRTW
jgi:hypothetical protein